MASNVFTMSVVRVAIILLALIRLVNTQAIGSFYFTDDKAIAATAVIVHNPADENFLYNINSAKGFGDFKPFKVGIVPRNGTAVACTGYLSKDSVYGAIFYQAQNSGIVELFFKCSYDAGTCVSYGDWYISNEVTVPVSPNTQLTATIFPTDIGYRVTYQDTQVALRQLAYANGTTGETTWKDGNLTGNYTIPDGYAFDTTTISPKNDTGGGASGFRETIYAVGYGEIKVSNATTHNTSSWITIKDRKTWSASPSIPDLSLPSFVNAQSHIATLAYSQWDCIFYIDNSSSLQFVRSTDYGLKYNQQPQMDLKKWPRADSPNAPITASVSNSFRDKSAFIFYKSGGKYVQVKIQNSEWADAQVVEATLPPPETPQSTDKSSGQKSLDRALKIKIGAGTGGAVALLLVLTVSGCWYRHMRTVRRKAGDIQKEDSIYGQENGSSEYGFAGKAELSGRSVERAELDHDPDCLLLHQLQVRRLAELRGEIPGELDVGVAIDRGELDSGVEVKREELDAGLCRCDINGANKEIFELASPVSELDAGEHWGDNHRKMDAVIVESEVSVEPEEGVILETASSLGEASTSAGSSKFEEGDLDNDNANGSDAEKGKENLV